MGRMLGWRLSQRGCSVTIYERSTRENPTSAAYVSASMLAPLSELPDANLEILFLSLQSLVAWPKILKELCVPFGLDGSLVVAHGRDRELVLKLVRNLERIGIRDIKYMPWDEMIGLEEGLPSKFAYGTYLPCEGWIDNRALLATLEARCGRIFYESEVEPENLSADLVCDCRGADANDPELRGVRGEIIRVHAPEVPFTRPIRLMHPRYQLYMSPRPNCEWVIGATDIESDSTKKITVRSASELLSAAYTLHTGFAEAEITEMSVGLRPAYADNLPRVRWHNGVLRINGLYRYGFLVAPAVIDMALEAVGETWKLSSTAYA